MQYWVGKLHQLFCQRWNLTRDSHFSKCTPCNFRTNYSVPSTSQYCDLEFQYLPPGFPSSLVLQISFHSLSLKIFNNVSALNGLETLIFCFLIRPVPSKYVSLKSWSSSRIPCLSKSAPYYIFYIFPDPANTIPSPIPGFIPTIWFLL